MINNQDHNHHLPHDQARGDPSSWCGWSAAGQYEQTPGYQVAQVVALREGWMLQKLAKSWDCQEGGGGV